MPHKKRLSVEQERDFYDVTRAGSNTREYVPLELPTPKLRYAKPGRPKKLTLDEHGQPLMITKSAEEIAQDEKRAERKKKVEAFNFGAWLGDEDETVPAADTVESKKSEPAAEPGGARVRAAAQHAEEVKSIVKELEAEREEFRRNFRF